MCIQVLVALRDQFTDISIVLAVHLGYICTDREISFLLIVSSRKEQQEQQDLVGVYSSPAHAF